MKNHLVKFFLFSLILSPFVVAFADNEKPDSHILPSPLIVEYTEKVDFEFDHHEHQLKCTSWRIAGEANNLSPWETIPLECAEYVKKYMMGRAYVVDLEMVSKEAGEFAKSVRLGDDGKDAWVFDIDETLLSNLPYYTEHGYGLEVFDHNEFDRWVRKAMAPAIEASLKLYEEIRDLGYKVFLLTGRSERHRSETIENLKSAGIHCWDKLILRTLEDHGKTATIYKSEKRNEMVDDGYRIIGNSGDQWSDLLGASLAVRSFKLPNPMYFIP
ncbi:Sigma1B-adaptin [Ranunculus cassubicifolius]